jgi:hypothetical protein
LKITLSGVLFKIVFEPMMQSRHLLKMPQLAKRVNGDFLEGFTDPNPV